MISYKNSLNKLKKSKLKIGDEIIDCTNSLNRVSALNIFSKVNNPSTNNAAFDGYAINSKDTKILNRKKKKLFEIVGSVAAGDKPLNKKIKKYQTVEIMTGGTVPKILTQLFQLKKYFYPNRSKPSSIFINKKIKKLQHIRLVGSDLKK